jgi:RNA polymerase sigma-70 factor (ECF subfamily)
MTSGDPALSDSWLSALYGELVGAIALFCGDQRVAEDVAQETLIKLWQRRDKVRDPRAWAFRCAFNTATSTFRRRAAEHRALVRVSSDRPVIVDQLAVVDRDLDLTRGLTTLPRRQRQAVLLHYLADLDLSQSAHVMGCSTGTVKAHLARALAALRNTGLIDQLNVDESGHPR